MSENEARTFFGTEKCQKPGPGIPYFLPPPLEISLCVHIILYLMELLMGMLQGDVSFPLIPCLQAKTVDLFQCLQNFEELKTACQ